MEKKEMLTQIKDRISDTLKDFAWDENNESVRLEIKTLVDSICNEYKESKSLYDFRCVFNNSDTIDEQTNDSISIDLYLEIYEGVFNVLTVSISNKSK